MAAELSPERTPLKWTGRPAYAARWVAKNVVAAGLARRCQVQLAYAIGVARPVSIRVDTFGTGTVADEVLEKAVRKTFDLRPTAIIRDLGLQSPFTGSWPPMATWAGRTWGSCGRKPTGQSS